MTTVVLGILQNQWFKDPVTVERILQKRPAMRRDLLRRCLFAGCLTGRRLRATFGAEWCQRIVWDEASPQLGAIASSKYDPDLDHLRAVIAEIKPDIVIGFGAVAQKGLALINQCYLMAPHPAARGEDVALRLREVRDRMLSLVERYENRRKSA